MDKDVVSLFMEKGIPVDCPKKSSLQHKIIRTSKSFIDDCNKSINWNLFINIYKKHASLRQHQITGHILEILSTETNIKISSKVINYFLNKQKSKTYISNELNKKFKYVSKWKLKDNVGKENILSWRY